MANNFGGRSIVDSVRSYFFPEFLGFMALKGLFL